MMITKLPKDQLKCKSWVKIPEGTHIHCKYRLDHFGQCNFHLCKKRVERNIGKSNIEITAFYNHKTSEYVRIQRIKFKVTQRKEKREYCPICSKKYTVK